jgi:hypothetical protein
MIVLSTAVTNGDARVGTQIQKNAVRSLIARDGAMFAVATIDTSAQGVNQNTASAGKHLLRPNVRM